MKSDLEHLRLWQAINDWAAAASDDRHAAVGRVTKALDRLIKSTPGAMQFDGTIHSARAIAEWMGNEEDFDDPPLSWLTSETDPGRPFDVSLVQPSGEVEVLPGDWVVRIGSDDFRRVRINAATAAGMPADEYRDLVLRATATDEVALVASLAARTLAGILSNPRVESEVATQRSVIRAHVGTARILMEEVQREPETPTCAKCAAGDFPFSDGGDFRHFLPGDDQIERATECPLGDSWRNLYEHEGIA